MSGKWAPLTSIKDPFGTVGLFVYALVFGGLLSLGQKSSERLP